MKGGTSTVRVMMGVLSLVYLGWLSGSLWLVTTESVLVRSGWLRPATLVGTALPWGALLGAILHADRGSPLRRPLARLALASAVLVGGCVLAHLLWVRTALFGALLTLDLAGVGRALDQLEFHALFLVVEAPLLSAASCYLLRGVEAEDGGPPPRSGRAPLRGPAGTRRPAVP